MCIKVRQYCVSLEILRYYIKIHQFYVSWVRATLSCSESDDSWPPRRMINTREAGDANLRSVTLHQMVAEYAHSIFWWMLHIISNLNTLFFAGSIFDITFAASWYSTWNLLQVEIADRSCSSDTVAELGQYSHPCRYQRMQYPNSIVPILQYPQYSHNTTFLRPHVNSHIIGPPASDHHMGARWGFSTILNHTHSSYHSTLIGPQYIKRSTKPSTVWIWHISVYLV